MSFDYNPYLHMEIVTEEDDGRWVWHCHGCGATSERIFSNVEAIDAIAESYREHLELSHKRTKEDFSNWSTY